MSFNLYVCQLIKVFKKGLQASCYKDRRNYWIFFFWIWIWGFLNIKDKRFKKYMYERARLWLCFCDLRLEGFRFVCVVASLCAVSVILDSMESIEWPSCSFLHGFNPLRIGMYYLIVTNWILMFDINRYNLILKIINFLLLFFFFYNKVYILHVWMIPE